MNFLNSLINFCRSRSDSNSKEISEIRLKILPVWKKKEEEREREIYTNEYFLSIKKKIEQSKIHEAKRQVSNN